MSILAKNILSINSGYDPSNKSEIEDVLLLQKILSNIGYKTTQDGKFGKLTEKNVMLFQKSKGLLEDGVVGKKTWNSLGVTFASPYDTTSINKTNKINEVKLISISEYEEAKKYKEIVFNLASKNMLDPYIIFGIGSRESAWGLALKPKGPEGTGDFIQRKNTNSYRSGPLPPDGKGFGRGLMQIDYDAHEFARTGKWEDPFKNIEYGCSVLVNNINFFSKDPILKNADNPDIKIKCAIAGYNCGPGRVKQALLSGLDIDYFTAHRNYSKNVLERLNIYKKLFEKK